jgi:hypothetical protein
MAGEVPIDTAGEQRGHGGKISPDQACALCGMSAHCCERVGGYLFADATQPFRGGFVPFLRGCSMTASGPGNTRLV